MNTDDIVRQTLAAVDDKYKTTSTHTASLQEFTKVYKETVVDLISAKQRYLQLVGKYSFADQHSARSLTMTGIAAMTPTYIDPNMASDTQEVQELGSVIIELEEQVNLAYARIRKLLELIVVSSSDLVDSYLAADKLMSEHIELSSGGGVYGHEPLLRYLQGKEKKR